jgi:hypothetical protein
VSRSNAMVVVVAVVLTLVLVLMLILRLILVLIDGKVVSTFCRTCRRDWLFAALLIMGLCWR